MKHTPPTPAQLAQLKNDLGLTGSQMAELCGYHGDDKRKLSSKWRRLTAPEGSASLQGMSYATLHHLAAQLVLSDTEKQKITDKMDEIKKPR